MPHHQKPPETSPTETAGDPAGRKILVIDDEPLIRDFLFEALAPYGYSVKCLESAKEALVEVGRSRYDLF